MRESMAELTLQFSSNRSVREYTEQHYIPGAAAYRERAADRGAAGATIVAWQHALKDKWTTLRFGEPKVDTRDGEHVFEVQLWLHGLDPRAVRVELYADATAGGTTVRVEMKRGRKQASPGGDSYTFSATVPAGRPPEDFTPRVIPHRAGVAVPLEVDPILWQR